MNIYRTYLCMYCVHYMACPVNAGIKKSYVKDCKITYLEEKKRHHIMVYECEKFKEREREYGVELPLPNETYRQCRICGRDFEVTKKNKTICSNPDCKRKSLKFRKSRQKGV